mmetsp:Transcript_8774/g.22349  ORF Transcript_8774/g.22349 Transcript_8774/m.22349 type:complete len:245 (+) Transcript_8774:614-1348(+)
MATIPAALRCEASSRANSFSERSSRPSSPSTGVRSLASCASSASVFTATAAIARPSAAARSLLCTSLRARASARSAAAPSKSFEAIACAPHSRSSSEACAGERVATCATSSFSARSTTATSARETLSSIARCGGIGPSLAPAAMDRACTCAARPFVGDLEWTAPRACGGLSRCTTPPAASASAFSRARAEARSSSRSTLRSRAEISSPAVRTCVSPTRSLAHSSAPAAGRSAISISAGSLRSVS